MFSAILNKIKEMVRKMLPKKSVEEIFHSATLVSDKMAMAIQLWSDMYEGRSPWLHEPDPENPARVVSLGLPSLIASEKARMVTLEMESEINAPTEEIEEDNPDYVAPSTNEDGTVTMGRGTPTIKSDKPKGPTERAEFLNKEYKKILKQIRRQLEYGIAKGGLVIKPYIVMYEDTTSQTSSGTRQDAQGTNSKKSANKQSMKYDKELPKAEIEFEFIQADRFFPLAFDANGKVTEAAFVQIKPDKAVQKVYIRLEHHKLVGRQATVQNLAFESENMDLASLSNINAATSLGTPISLQKVPEWANLEPTTTIDGVDRLLFAYFRMPEANTIDPYSPLGVSGYSRVVNLIKDADMQYSRLLWEFEAGEMAIDVDRDAMRLVELSNGESQSMLPTKQQRLFRKIDLNSEETYNVFAPALRDASLTNGLNTIFMRIEDACGLSRGTISDVTTQEAKTATELKILKQRSYATNADIQKALQEALEDAIYVMDVYCTLYEVTPDGEYEVSFEWDDSIIVDSESELSKRITLMQNGISSKQEVRMWYFGETENQAKAALLKVQDESKQAQEQNILMQQELSEAQGDTTGQQVKSAGDTTSAKKSTGQQADSLANPTKGKSSSDTITIGK